MRLCCFSVLAAGVCAAASLDDITPRVGVVEVYGARKVSVQKIRSAVGVKPGDPLPSRDAVEERLEKVPGVLASRMKAKCCDARNMILYVGIEDKDSPHFEFHTAPAGDITLREDIVAGYQAFLDVVATSLHGRDADEDLTNGYSLMADPEARRLQQEFLTFAEQNLTSIDRVLRESSDGDQRTMAAYLIQYAPRRPRTSKVMVDALQYALQDREDTVRETAMRSLEAIAIGAKMHPDQQIRIEPTWLVELMNSMVWTDRRYASQALVNMTETHDVETLALIRARALQSVIEMARWRDLQHALPAFILAGRLAGYSEQDIKAAWVGGDRENVLEEALNPKKKHHAKTAKLPS